MDIFDFTLFYFLFSDNVESTVSFTRRDLYDIMRDCKGKKIEEKLEFLGTKLVEITQCPDYKKNYFGSHSEIF